MFEVFVQQLGAGTFSKFVPIHIVGETANRTLCGRAVYRDRYRAMAYDAACERLPEVAAKRICACCQDRQTVREGKPSRAHDRQQTLWQTRVDAWNKAMGGER